METPESLSWEEQVALLKEQGMEIYDSDAETLKQISYYRIKEFAEPLAQRYNGTIHYEGISFAKVIERYYQDKNLRIHLLHAIEQVETALKTKIAYILGKRYGAYGYLNFYKWANRSKYTDFYIEEKQYKFKKKLKETVKRSSLPDIRYRQNQNKDGFPTVWLAIDSLMFGGLTTIISIMGKRNLIPLANYFHCTGKELVSWVRMLNFIRNVCAHGANLIDIRLKTVPLIRTEWKKYLFSDSANDGENENYKRLGTVIFVLITLVNSINEKYRWNEIQRNINTICNHRLEDANLLGFRDAQQSLKIKKCAKELQHSKIKSA